MKKYIQLFKCCLDCPYHKYNPDNAYSFDSGYDCLKAQKRIIDDDKICASNWPQIPLWCPLPEAGPEDIIISKLETEDKIKRDISIP